MSSPLIKLKRGAYADLPTLGVGEPGFTTDRYQLYVGSPDGNKLIGGGEFWNLNSTTSGGGIKIYEASNNGTNFVELKSPDLLGSDLSLTLPATDGNADQVLKTDGSGNLTFAAVNTLSNAGLDDIVEDTSPQLGGNLDLNSSNIIGTGNINHTGSLTSSGDASLKGGVAVVSSAGVKVTGIVTASSFVGNLATTNLTGTIANSQLAGSIIDSKLNQITTADKVALSALDINGGTDIGEDIVDADLFVVDDGAGGTNRKTDASRIKSYVLGGSSGATFNNITVGSSVDIDSNGINAPTGIVTASSFVGNITGNLTGTVQTASQTNITSVGTLGSLAVTNNITVGGSVDGRDIASDGTNQDSLQTLIGVSAGSTTLGSFTGTTISDNIDVKGVIQELETQLDFIGGGGAQAASVSVGATDTDASFFPTFVSDNNADPAQEVFKTDAGISYNPSSNLLSVTSVSASGGITAAGDVTANGNIVGDDSTNITGINQVTATTFVGALTGNSTSSDTVDVTDDSSTNTSYQILFTDGDGSGKTLREDTGLNYNPSSNTISTGSAELSGYVRFDGAGVQVDGFTDEDNMSSNSATKLPTQQSVKSYVDTEIGNISQTITLNGDSTAGIVTTGNVLSIDGTTNEIETAVVSDTFTIGLPASVVVTTELEVPTLEVGAIQANDGTASMTVANSTGKVTASGDFEVQGATTVQALTAQGNVSLGDQSSDTVGITGRINTDVIPSTDSAKQLGSNSLRWSEVYGDNVTGTNFTAAGIMTASQYKGGTMTLTGGGTFGGNVDISGNLSIGGSITSINVDDFKSVSPLIEVGLEDVGNGTFQPPSFQTQYNTGIAMWYNSVGVSSDNAKAASIFASVKPGGSFRVGFATVVSFSGSGTTDGVATVTNWADIEAKGLWINDCAGQSQVISCTGSERFLNNITVDGGSFS